MRAVTSKKIYSGRYKVIDKKTKKHLGYVEQCFETKVWYIQDVDGTGHDLVYTKIEAMASFENEE